MRRSYSPEPSAWTPLDRKKDDFTKDRSRKGSGKVE